MFRLKSIINVNFKPLINQTAIHYIKKLLIHPHSQIVMQSIFPPDDFFFINIKIQRFIIKKGGERGRREIDV